MNASVLWIDHKAGRAEFADSFVLFDVARPVFRTGGILARIATLVVDAGHGRRAASISQADRHGRSAVFHADADGPVVQHLTDFVGRSARIAGTNAGTLTPSGNASQVAGAIVVHTAFDLVRSASHLARVVQHEPVLTDADGPMPTDFAALAWIASHVLEDARILTSGQIGVASVILRALAVPGADGDGQRRRPGRGLHWTSGRGNDGNRSLSRRAAAGVRHALEGWPADVALRARAAGLVQDDVANGVLAASVSQGARILTLAIDARLVHRAVAVDGAGSI